MAQAQAFQQTEVSVPAAASGGQLAFDLKAARPARGRIEARERQTQLCAGCRAKEARYGFRPEGVEADATDRPRALCFECFRMELDRRRMVAEQLARGWNASQVGLPLEDTLNELSLRRRRAQIAARRALAAADTAV